MLKEKAENPAIDESLLTFKKLSASEEMKLIADAREKQRRDEYNIILTAKSTGFAKGMAKALGKDLEKEIKKIIEKCILQKITDFEKIGEIVIMEISIAEGEKKTVEKLKARMKALGYSDEQIREIFNN